ncbi:MAG: alpha-1,2-fucosyltransferase [Candidatus Cloacimonadota bacterium]|nr:MAG: alpha-1,2-fucosyltransferase [Candidatus Cloacimonadota bacterium]
MIVSRIFGGLGNQIFQVGAALLLAKKKGCTQIIFDVSSLGSYETKRKNELLSFFNFDSLNIEVSFTGCFVTRLRIPKILAIKHQYYPFVGDSNFEFVIENSKSKFFFLDGYFQASLIQKHFDEEIELLNMVYIQRNLKRYNDCIIHIRGGDFVKLGWDVVNDKSYYESAINRIKSVNSDVKFLVVTDDRAYAEKLLNGIDIVYQFIGKNMIDDFNLIGGYQYQILSSSTFALWASCLGQKADGLVFAPKYWLPDLRRQIKLPNEVK